MRTRGLKAHTHAQRAEIVAQLVPLWQEKFGDNLLGIAAGASYGRGEDVAYSDLELDLFVKELPAGEDAYYQRVVDGLLIEVIYHTPEQFLAERTAISPHWYISASDRLVPVYHAPFIEKLAALVEAASHQEDDFFAAAAQKRYELQEATAKILNAVEQENVEGISLLVMDAALHILQMLALINQKPFTTFSRFIAQARQFSIKPAGFDDLLDILVQGTYQNLAKVGEVFAALFTGMEQIFSENGVTLYDDLLDPRLPNTPAAPKALVRLEPVNREDFQACSDLPTGPDHRHVAPNLYSIAEAQFFPGARSCCIYAGEELVGYILYEHAFDDQNFTRMVWISRLMIAENKRAQGYGRAALQQVIAAARLENAAKVALSTHPDNFKGIKLYESLGFRATVMAGDEMVYELTIS